MRHTPAELISQLVPPLLTRVVAAAYDTARRWVAGVRIGKRSRLHLACGSNLIEGWANIDLSGSRKVIKLDLTGPLPVAADSVDRVFCEHFIEHIEYEQAAHLVAECHRALRPGGVLRVSTPNLHVLVDRYLRQDLNEWRDVGWVPETPCRLLNESMRLWGHRFLFDADELRRLFSEAGFTHIEQVSWRVSRHADLGGLECRPNHGELIFECVK